MFCATSQELMISISEPRQTFLPSVRKPILVILTNAALPLNVSRVCELISGNSLNNIQRTAEQLIRRNIIRHIPNKCVLGHRRLSTPTIQFLTKVQSRLLHQLHRMTSA